MTTWIKQEQKKEGFQQKSIVLSFPPFPFQIDNSSSLSEQWQK